MNKIYRAIILLSVLLLPSINTKSYSQNTTFLWEEVSDKNSVTIGERSGIPLTYRILNLDLQSMISVLNNSIDDNLPNAFSTGPIISLPMPDGSFSRFSAAYTSVMPKELADKFPMIRTFTAKGIDDSLAVARLDYTEWGFHAMIMTPNGWIFIDPVSIGNSSQYICYDRSNSIATRAFVCETMSEIERQQMIHQPTVIDLYRSSGTILKTYRLALACTGEYAAFYGGTVSGALSGMVTSVNRVTAVYEVELSIRLVLIANNNLLVYTNSATDPYTNGSGSTMLTENQNNITTIIGSANYDIGHVFSTGGGGVAGLGVVCSSANKARGVTGSTAPVGDNYDIDYVAHEIGHQYGGNHTFNSVTGSCSGNRSSGAAYEPGSGTTIMAYAGICGADNTQPHSDAIFHTKSYDEIQIYTTTGTGNTCPVTSSTGNIAPVVTLPPNRTIPYLTSFILTGSATDANSDPLTYLWEEYDLGTQGAPNSPSGNAPIFRDFVPSTNPARTFPRIEDIVRNIQTIGEILPSYARSLTFRFTARDNRIGGGGVMHDDNVVTLTVANTADTFKVTSPNTNVSWTGGTNITVTWKVASTTAAPVSCANVNILLSIDSGYTFPYTLISNTLNDGSEVVTLPNVISNKARIKIESVGNIFFDMSNVNFTIVGSSPILTLISTQPLSSNSLCAGQILDVDFSTDGPANAGNIFTAQLSNATGSFSSPVDIGTLLSINSGTISSTIPGGTPAGSGYLIRVISSNPSVIGSDNRSNISISQPVGTPGTFTGSSTVCQGQTGVAYSIPVIANASSYNWTLPSGASITSGANTNSINVSYSAIAASGTITVQGTNSGCGTGSVSSPFSVTVNTLPTIAGNISGTSSICQGAQGINYSTAPITGATGYLWTLPAGASITSGFNTNNILVDYSSSATSGSITVNGTNGCGNGAASSFSVIVLSAPSPPIISADGPTGICIGEDVILSYTQLSNAAYQWRKNNVSISGETSSSYTASTSGVYDVISGLSQTFSNTNLSTIPDNSCTGGSSTITVSGYTGTITSAGITIKLNISHTYVGDLVLVLQSANGSLLGLSNRTGLNSNGGDNFTNTIFSDGGATVIPTSGAPYTGTYKPVASVFTNCVTTTITSFSAIGGGSINPNGNWILKVYDRAASDLGSITNWSITFPASVNGPCYSVSDPVPVTVSSPVSAGVSITANPGNTICDGTSVTFTASAVNGGTSPVYQWKNGTISVGTNNSVYSTSTLNDGNVITCEMISNSNCVSGSPATSNPISMTVNIAPIINSFSPGTGNIGSTVIISGSGYMGVSSVIFNGISASYTINNNNQISAIVPAGASSGQISITNNCGITTSASNFIIGGNVTLNIRVIIEGFHIGGGQMTGVLSPLICDTIVVNLAESTFPYSIINSVKDVISINGDGNFVFPSSAFNNSYFIVIKHRNSLETWSANPLGLSSSTVTYDFTTSASQAFGNNLINSGGVFAMRSGDIDQNGIINLNDINGIITSTLLFNTGYMSEDLTGDRIVESTDLSIVECNQLIEVAKP